MLLPTGHENMQARRWPIMTIGLIAINVIAFLLTFTTMESESPELAETRPERVRDELDDRIQRRGLAAHERRRRARDVVPRAVSSQR